MFIYPESKNISNILRQNSAILRGKIYTAFEESILNCDGEIQFIQSLVGKLNASLNSSRIQGLEISCRSAVIHQKPIVAFSDSKCELGDMLVLVKYHTLTGKIEAKGIIYQVKLSRKDSLNCAINQQQLELLCSWPEFSFGCTPDNKFKIKPHTIEFGSFMLEPRNPKPGSYLAKNRNRCFGITPYALLVRDLGPKSVNINSFPYTRGDVHNFISQIVFEIGEYHQNDVKRLIDALYRYAGLAPDPPDEFKGYSIDSKKDGFAILEINIKRENSSFVSKPPRSKERCIFY